MNFLFLRTWSRRRALSYFLHLPEPTINDERQDLFVSKAVISRVVTIDNIVFYSKNIKTYWRKKIGSGKLFECKNILDRGRIADNGRLCFKIHQNIKFLRRTLLPRIWSLPPPWAERENFAPFKEGRGGENCLNLGERANLNHNCRYFNI